jgi:patatin-like phospholipase/acyl hydrolase
MHTLMHKENTKRAEDGEARLSEFPKPCDYFDLIGGTGTGGCVRYLLSLLYYSRVIRNLCISG